VLMDYRCDHLSFEQRQQAPTFLYVMDLGQGRFFVEETSLAAAPALSFVSLQQRLEQRLAHRGIAIEAVEHVEHCLFPMNPALPDRRQPVVGFGGAASMVHPASGYMIGSLLRRGPPLAADLAAALAAAESGRMLVDLAAEPGVLKQQSVHDQPPQRAAEDRRSLFRLTRRLEPTQ